MRAFWLQMKILVEGAKPFQEGRKEDAGYDIFSIEHAIIPPLTAVGVKTGIITAFPPGWVGLIRDRGSVGFAGMICLAGVIDSGYRDQWRVKLFNSSNKVYVIESVLHNPNAAAIAQVVFLPYGKVEPLMVNELPTSERDITGFGSTDKGK